MSLNDKKSFGVGPCSIFCNDFLLVIANTSRRDRLFRFFELAFLDLVLFLGTTAAGPVLSSLDFVEFAVATSPVLSKVAAGPVAAPLLLDGPVASLASSFSCFNGR